MALARSDQVRRGVRDCTGEAPTRPWVERPFNTPFALKAH